MDVGVGGVGAGIGAEEGIRTDVSKNDWGDSST